MTLNVLKGRKTEIKPNQIKWETSYFTEKYFEEEQQTNALY